MNFKKYIEKFGFVVLREAFDIETSLKLKKQYSTILLMKMVNC